MNNTPLVSIITPFYNTPMEFFKEAIQSVFVQTYSNWELILIDDGSTGPISDIAKTCAKENPGKVHYYEHPNHENKGHSAARNLGLLHAKGEYIAFLDADDIWMSDKLEGQVALLKAYPDVGMVYANTQYWFSWTNNPSDAKRDFMPVLGIRPGTIIQPPYLLPLLINGKVTVPSMNTLVVRREAINRCGGFDERFRSLYGDQHFYAKLCLFENVYVSGDCVDRYRQHPESTTGKAYKLNKETISRKFFLQWLKNFMIQKRITNEQVWMEVSRELWRINLPEWFPENDGLQKIVRWVKKWILRTEKRFLPHAIRNSLWARIDKHSHRTTRSGEIN